MIVSKAIEQSLNELTISSDEFSELLIRLLDYGIISREESLIEGALYDRYVQCHELVEDYLSVLKIRIKHDKKFDFIRIYPPGSDIPGEPSDDHSAFNSGLRVKPSQQEVAVILALRVEYEKALREGLVNDKGCVLLSLEGLSIALNNVLKRSLPESLGERKALFKRLKQLRLIQFNNDMDIDGDDVWMTIHPSITSFVSDDVLVQLQFTDHDDDEIRSVKPQIDTHSLSNHIKQENSDKLVSPVIDSNAHSDAKIPGK